MIQNESANQLGYEFYEEYVQVNKKQQDMIPNVYTAGDINTGRHHSILAAASCTLAVISIYEELIKNVIRINDQHRY